MASQCSSSHGRTQSAQLTDPMTEDMQIVREDAGPLEGGTAMIIAFFPIFSVPSGVSPTLPCCYEHADSPWQPLAPTPTLYAPTGRYNGVATGLLLPSGRPVRPVSLVLHPIHAHHPCERL